MSVEASLPCYLVEWYRPGVTAEQLNDTASRLGEDAAAICDESATVRLLLTLAVPTDEVVYGVFAALSAQTVSEVCRRAGIPAERLSDAIAARVAS